MGQIFQYYVEGQCEQKMIDTILILIKVIQTFLNRISSI